jgi:hypothetical protein
MKQYLTALLLLTAACAGERNENSAICGMTHLASANAVLNQTQNLIRALDEWPEDVTGEVPARVVGFGSGTAIVGETEDGVIAGFQGEGFPQLPGFGLGLVDDSSEVFRGILIYDIEVPPAFPQVGGVAGERLVIPLFAFRVTWDAVNDPDCPLFATRDTTSAED